MEKEIIQMESEMPNSMHVDITANPAPLGLMGFGMTTVLLNLHNAGIFELGSMILAMGIFAQADFKDCFSLLFARPEMDLTNCSLSLR